MDRGREVRTSVNSNSAYMDSTIAGLHSENGAGEGLKFVGGNGLCTGGWGIFFTEEIISELSQAIAIWSATRAVEKLPISSCRC